MNVVYAITIITIVIIIITTIINKKRLTGENVITAPYSRSLLQICVVPTPIESFSEEICPIL